MGRSNRSGSTGGRRLGLGGLFLQVTKIDQALETLQSDITELKTDSKERLADLESRVRRLEISK